MMHPALRQMKPTSSNRVSGASVGAAAAASAAAASATSPHPPSRGGRRPPADTLPPPLEADEYQSEGEGVARLNARPDTHPRVAIKKDTCEAYVPEQNVFRDREGEYGEGVRDLQFRAGAELRRGLQRDRVLRQEDFEVDERLGVSPARVHMGAADLVSAYEQTVKQEVNFQTAFGNYVRTLLAREEVTHGLMHLWDFAEAYVTNPSSKTLTAQLLLIIQHLQDEGIFREAFLNLAEPEGRWLLDLLNVLQSIVVQERSLSLGEKVAAVNYAVVSLGRHYARKIFKTAYVPMDKEVKVSTFYMRAVLKLLTLSDDLGVYRNERVERLASLSRRRELSDRELLYNLKRALTADNQDSFDEGQDLQWSQPASKGTTSKSVTWADLDSEEDF